MCGICGVLNAELDEPVELMTRRIRHRGPDGAGVKVVANSTLGHTRLAIIDVEGGHQPMQAGKAWVVFNGEIYNHNELRQKFLPDANFENNSDTEVLPHLYQCYGPDFVRWLVGMYAFVIKTEKDFLIARDPIGIKPLYWAREGKKIFFASEIKALVGFSKNIREFPAGHYFHSKTGLHRFYRLAEGSPPITETEEQARKAIAETIRRAVLRRLMSDVPLGVSLSGGLDSSIIAALAREDLDQLHTFAVGVEGSEDLQAARLVAKQLDTNHYELVYSESDMLGIIPEVIYALESFDPALVRSAIPNYFLAKLAADHVKVFLTGEGADELYAGYDYLADFKEPQALEDELSYITGSLHNTNLQRADRISMAHGLEARVPFLDVDSIALAFNLPAEWKLHQPGKAPKHLLRQAFRDFLPDAIVNRPKQKFSKGAGSSEILALRAEQEISDTEFAGEHQRLAKQYDVHLKNKEALYYYRIMREHFDDEHILPNIGHSRSL